MIACSNAFDGLLYNLRISSTDKLVDLERDILNETILQSAHVEIKTIKSLIILLNAF